MEVFTRKDWVDATGLKRALLEHMVVNEKNLDQAVEIERKWLVKPSLVPAFVDKATSVKVIYFNSVYMSVDPEIRVREYYTSLQEFTHCMLCYKGKGNLKRVEVQCECSREVYLRAANIVNKSIHPYFGNLAIPFKMWIIEDGLYRYEIKSIDLGREYQLEIEVPDEKSATEIVLPDYVQKHVIREVTNDAAYKLANRWKITRLD